MHDTGLPDFSLWGRVKHAIEAVDKKSNAVIDVQADFGAVGDGVTDDTAAIVAALEAADAAGTDHSNNWSENAPGQTYTVYFPPGVYLTDTISLDDLNVNIWGAGPAATRIRANSGIGGYVLDMRGWKGHMEQFRGSGPFGNFSIEGTHTADATLAEGGLIMGKGTTNTNGPGGYNLQNISILGTGGPAFKMMPGCHLGKISDLTLQRPVSADTNDVPYLHVFGDSNGVIWDRLGFISLSPDPDGTKVAYWEFDTVSGTANDSPNEHAIRNPWSEGTDTPSGGSIYWLECKRSVLSHPHIHDPSVEASPAAAHSVVRFAAFPGGIGQGTANEVHGRLIADNGGALFSYAVIMESDGNRYIGPTPFQNKAVYLASGVDYNYVELAGLGATTGSTPWVDDSANTTNTLIDHSSRTFVPTSSAYTPSNVTTTRTFDADATSVAELADVVGTLIADLQGAKHVG